jgi:hypothetical protein
MFDGRQVAMVLAASVFLTLLALAPVGYIAYRNAPPRIATVDLQKLVEEEQKRTMDVLAKGGGSVTDEQRSAVEKLTVDFARKLSLSIDQVGIECGCVIVNKAALLGGTTLDYTQIVRDRIGRKETP